MTEKTYFEFKFYDKHNAYTPNRVYESKFSINFDIPVNMRPQN